MDSNRSLCLLPLDTTCYGLESDAAPPQLPALLRPSPPPQPTQLAAAPPPLRQAAADAAPERGHAQRSRGRSRRGEEEEGGQARIPSAQPARGGQAHNLRAAPQRSFICLRRLWAADPKRPTNFYLMCLSATGPPEAVQQRAAAHSATNSLSLRGEGEAAALRSCLLDFRADSLSTLCPCLSGRPAIVVATLSNDDQTRTYHLLLRCLLRPSGWTQSSGPSQPLLLASSQPPPLRRRLAQSKAQHAR